MRKMKDPEIRQKKFIEAASALFMRKGYDAVSIREILDAVKEKAASPSVFYYYFPSKENLYQICVRHIAAEYLAAVAPGLKADNRSLTERFIFLFRQLQQDLQKNRRLLHTGSSTVNHFFILDMRDQVTNAFATMGAAYLQQAMRYTPKEAQMNARFLVGGIGEMLYRYMLDETQSAEDTAQVMERIMHFVLNNIRFSDAEKSALSKAWEKEKR